MRSWIVILSLLVSAVYSDNLGIINGLKVASSVQAIDNSVTVEPVNDKQRAELKIYTETGKTGLVGISAADNGILESTNEISGNDDEVEITRTLDKVSKGKTSTDPFRDVPVLENDLLPPLQSSTRVLKNKSVSVQTTTDFSRDLEDTDNLVRLNGLIKSVELDSESATISPVTVAPLETVIEQTAGDVLPTLRPEIVDKSKALDDVGLFANGKSLDTLNLSPVTVGPILSVQGGLSVANEVPIIQTNVVGTRSGGLESTIVESPITVEPTIVPTAAAKAINDGVVLINSGVFANGGLATPTTVNPISIIPSNIVQGSAVQTLVPTLGDLESSTIVSPITIEPTSAHTTTDDSAGRVAPTTFNPVSITPLNIVQGSTVQTLLPTTATTIITSGSEAFRTGDIASSSGLLSAPGLISVNGLLINSEQLDTGRVVNTGGLVNTPVQVLNSGELVSGLTSGGAVLTPPHVIAPNPFSSIPQTTEYRKQFFSFSAPDEDEEEVIVTKQLSNVLKKNLQTFFIKSPENNAATKVLLQLAKQAVSQKAVIYVLTKEDDSLHIIGELQKMQENMPIKPDVTFIKYKNPEDLAYAKEQIKTQFDTMMGTSQDIDGGVAPVLKFETAVIDVPNASALPITKGVSLGDIVTGGELVSKTSSNTTYLPSNPL